MKKQNKGEQLTRRLVMEAYYEEKEQMASVPLNDFEDHWTSSCPDCGDKSSVKDMAKGAIVCTSCGLVLDRVFGTGLPDGPNAGQNSSHDGTHDSEYLDKLTREKALKTVTKYHKRRLNRLAATDLRLLCNNDREFDLALHMFDCYSKTREKVKQFDLVVRSCAACANTLLKRQQVVARNFKELPTFPCSTCGKVFDCKKDLRLHMCNETPNKSPLLSKKNNNYIGSGDSFLTDCDFSPSPSPSPPHSPSSSRTDSILEVKEEKHVVELAPESLEKRIVNDDNNDDDDDNIIRNVSGNRNTLQRLIRTGKSYRVITTRKYIPKQQTEPSEPIILPLEVGEAQSPLPQQQQQQQQQHKSKALEALDTTAGPPPKSKPSPQRPTLETKPQQPSNSKRTVTKKSSSLQQKKRRRRV